MTQPAAQLAPNVLTALHEEEAKPLHPLAAQLSMSMETYKISTIQTVKKLKFILWNFCMAANPTFKRNIKDLLAWKNPSVLAFIETRLYEINH